MLENNDFALSIGTLLVLRYKILELERFWAYSFLPDPNGDGPPQQPVGGGIYRAQDLVAEDHIRLVHVTERIVHEADWAVGTLTLHELEREAENLAVLHHPALPIIHDSFTTADRAYVVTNYETGQTLDSVIQSEDFAAIDMKTIIRWIVEICDVIGYMHELEPPLLFRALEAKKIILNHAGHLYLTDLSGATYYERGVRSSLTGVDGYAAPEQYRGEHVPQSDIYSIGALLHYLLTRRDPRQAKRFSFVDRPVRQLNPKVSKALDLIVYKALAFDPKRRYQDVRDMQDALVAQL